jgi:hypothetical protein
MTHVAWILYFVVWAVILGIVWAMCRAAAKPTPEPEMSTYRGPNDSALDYAEFYYGHVDRNSGRRSYAEGRPTMPSEVEPELERERRTR